MSKEKNICESKINDIISFSFSNGGFFEGYIERKIIYMDNKVIYKQYSNKKLVNSIEINKEIWLDFIKSILNINILSWEKHYNNPNILDGEQWDINIKFHSGDEIEISGSNEYPKEWENFIEIINKYFTLYKEKKMKNQRYLPIKQALIFFKERDFSEIILEINAFFKNTYNNIGRGKSRAINKGFIVIELEKTKLLNEFIDEYWQNGKTEDGEKIIKRYKNKYYTYQDELPEKTDEFDDFDNSKFAYETDLRDYLAKNLNIIEKELILYRDKNGKTGVEYTLDESNKRIDILAIDKNNIPVIIELKVNRGYEKVIGQCQYYKNKIKDIFKTEKVRVIIIARQITEYLKMGTMDMIDYELFEYKLNIKLDKIK